MSITNITDILNKTNARKIVLLCHHNADPDAICSAYAFSRLLNHHRPELNIEIGAAQGISRLSKHLLTTLPIDVKLAPDVENVDCIVLLDTNTVQQLGDYADKVKSSKKPIIVIDHHASHPETALLATVTVTDEEASSTCEIVYDLYKQLQITPDQNEAKALFLGIAYDSRHFVLANAMTLKNVAQLVEVGVNPQETLHQLSLPMDFSERIARLKSSKRAKLLKIGPWIVALSQVSAYEASAARALLELGADVAVVAGQKNENVEISLRADHEFSQKTQIHLGRDIAKPLGEYLNGMGGGHSTAAGVNGVGRAETSLRKCVSILREKLE